MDKISHYTLPRITELLYEKEAMSSIALSKEIANKINELVDAYNTLYTERITKAQEQDGKINKAILYIKDNLSNTLHDMFSIMEVNGEIKALVDEMLPVILEEKYTFVDTIEERIDGNYTVKDIRYPYGHVRRYGAVGNGETDDTEALNIAATVCRNNGYALIANAGEYLISGDVDFTYIPTIAFDGNIKCTDSARVKIGNSSANGMGSYIQFGNVDSIHVTGLKNSRISFNIVNDLYLYANSKTGNISSIGYCTFVGNRANNVTLFSEGKNIAWINENVFKIKRVENISIDGNYDHNNNHFEHCNLERGKVTLKNARNNYISARCEGGVTINDEGNPNTNLIEKEYYYKHYFDSDVTETENNTVSFYPVNKLQTEHYALVIDRHNKHFPYGSLYFNEDGMFNPSEYKNVFDSGVVDLTHSIAIKVNSSEKCFRTKLVLYDANDNHVFDDNVFTDGRMTKASSDISYYIPSNVAVDSICLYKNSKVKKFRFTVYFGNDVSDLRVKYLRVKYIKYIGTNFEMHNSLKYDTYKSIPTTGYWEVGQKLYANSPKSGQYIGIICTESGVPGTWRNFGMIQ